MIGNKDASHCSTTQVVRNFYKAAISRKERNGRVRKKLEVYLHNFSTTKWKQAKSGLVPGNSTINIVFMVKCVPIKSTLWQISKLLSNEGQN